MTYAEITAFVERLSGGKIEPSELADLTVADFHDINRFLKKRYELVKREYVDAAFISRMAIWPPNLEQKRIYSESEILAELESFE